MADLSLEQQQAAREAWIQNMTHGTVHISVEHAENVRACIYAVYAAGMSAGRKINDAGTPAPVATRLRDDAARLGCQAVPASPPTGSEVAALQRYELIGVEMIPKPYGDWVIAAAAERSIDRLTATLADARESHKRLVNEAHKWFTDEKFAAEQTITDLRATLAERTAERDRAVQLL